MLQPDRQKHQHRSRTMKTLSHKTQTAIDKYGESVCCEAYQLNRHQGEGASTIGHMLGLTTNQADAAIDAWEEVLEARESNTNDTYERV